MELQKEFKDILKKDYFIISYQVLLAFLTFLITGFALLLNSTFIYKNQIIIISLILLFISLIVQIVLIYLSTSSKSHAITIADKINLEQNISLLNSKLTKVSNISRQLNCLSYVVHASIFFLNMFYHSNAQGQEDEESFKNFLTFLINNIFFKSMQEMFENNPNEYFSVAIYLHDKEHNVLWDFGVGGKDKQITNTYKPGRIWHVNDVGHVCYCYNLKQELIHTDIEKQMKAINLKPICSKEYDYKHYKSAITLPISIEEEDKSTIRGVFCITSSETDCFYSEMENINIENDELTYTNRTKTMLIRIFNEIISMAFNIFYGKNNPIAPQDLFENEQIKEYLAKMSN